MKGYLADTSIALFASVTPERLSLPIRRALEVGPNVISVISYWEVILKVQKGKLRIGDPQDWWHRTVNALAFRVLPFHPHHLTALITLPPIHQDPFDRALIAQATAEELSLLTSDGIIPRDAGERLHVIV